MTETSYRWLRFVLLMSASAAVIAGTLRIAWFGVQDRIAILLIVTCAISALGMFGL
jgi:hypothetical protein